jgi:hypothetical protein
MAKRVVRREWTAQDERALKKHSKEKTPVAAISKESSKAHARCTQAKGAQSWNFGWASSASKEANSAVLNALHAYCPNG